MADVHAGPVGIIGNEGNEKIRKKDQAAAARLGYALDRAHNHPNGARS